MIDSQRVLMVTWWIGGILLTTFYTANLTASLAKPAVVNPIKNPSELTKTANKDANWLTLYGDPLHTKILVISTNIIYHYHLKVYTGNHF